jgi:tetratricopeptide (TPR) repeat protein/transcriptional regulator with XRE-family HTH domain
METRARERARPSFGTLLRHYRVAAGLTQEELAERASLSRRSITAMEQGTVHTPRRDSLDLLAAALALAAHERAVFLEAGRHRGTYGPSSQGEPAGADVAPPFVGRASELALLGRHLAGQGPPVLLLAGEPGIGKSRLLHAAIPRAAAQGWRVLEGGCGRRGGQEPYAPILEALQRHIRGRPVADLRVQLRGCAWLVRLLPELADGPIEPVPLWTVSAEQERRLMVEAVVRFMTNVAGPAGTLLLLDDLQWAGPDALDLLATLVRAAAAAPLRVIGAYRDTEVRTQGALSLLLADLAHRGLAAHRRLAPLAPAEAAILLDGLLTDAAEVPRARVLERAGGVPFFLVSCVEGLRHSGLDGGQDTLPWAVEQSMRQRLAALPAGADEVLATAAVVGREVTLALLVTVTRLDKDTVLAACDAACRARLLEEHGADGYRFAHDAIREVLENDLGAGRRALAHGRIAEALEQAPGERPVELLCYHYERCGDQDKAVHYLEQAGDQARAQAAYATAEKHYRDLIERLDRLGRLLDSPGVREKLAGVLATTARYDAALAILDQATETLHVAGDLEGLGRIAALMGNIHFHRGTLEEGVACLLPLRERLEARGPSVALAMVYCALAELNLNWGHWAQEEVAAERAGHIARLVGDDRSLARAELLRGVARSLMSQDDEELTVLLEAIRLAETINELECLCQALVYVTEVYADRGEFEQSRRHGERALLMAEKVGNPVLTADAMIGLGLLAFYGGDWARARGYYQRASVIHRQIAISPLSCEAGGLLVVQGQLLQQEGAWEEACRCLEEGRIIFAPQGKRSGLRNAQSTLAEYDILAGRPAAARERLLPILDRSGMEERDVTLYVLPVLAWACLEMGDMDQANRVVTEAIRRARTGMYRLRLVEGLRVQALVMRREGQWAGAEGVLEEGLALARGIPYPYGEGRLLDVSGRLHRDRGEPAAARERLKSALAIFRRLGARKDIERTEQVLATLT